MVPKYYAVIVAGGSGSRMGGTVPKQFRLLAGKPVFMHALVQFKKCFPDITLILVLPEPYLVPIQIMMEAFPGYEQMRFVAGGPTRFHSVKNGLSQVAEPGLVFVHDAARPFINAELLLRCSAAANSLGNAIPAVAVTDSMRSLTESGSKPVDRSMLRIIQTPQTFRSEIIVEAFRLEYSDLFTDEATVAEAAGYPVHLVEGLKMNFKITTPEDLILAEAFLAGQNKAE